MTKPTITWGHGYLTDCDDATGWTETESSLVAALTVEDGDVFKIEGTCNDAGDEYVHYEKDITDISSTLYNKYLVRWKTSAAANGLKAYISFEYDDASFDDVDLGFSTSWTVSSGTIDTAKTLDKIRFGATDDPNSIDAGTFQVYYDFLMVHVGTFTFPFVDGTEDISLQNNIVYVKIPRRVGNITQYQGADSPIIRLNGKMDTNTSWAASGYTTLGFDLMRILKEMHKDPFQWLTTDLLGTSGGCKVTMPKLKISKVAGSKSQRLWELEMRNYSKSGGDASSWPYLSWIGAK